MQFQVMLKRSFRLFQVVSSKRIVNYGNHGWLWLEPCAVARGMHTIRVFLKTRVWYTSNESK
ncbi:unnamed protein product, partial [Rotaria socialis]